MRREDLGAELGEIERVFMLAALAVKRGRSLLRRGKADEGREELRIAEGFGFKALERLMEATRPGITKSGGGGRSPSRDAPRCP